MDIACQILLPVGVVALVFSLGYLAFPFEVGGRLSSIRSIRFPLPRFGLRTLLLVATVGPPLLAGLVAIAYTCWVRWQVPTY